MWRIRIWQAFLEILNLWGSFLGLVTRKFKIQIIHVFRVKKHGESESELKISKNTCHMWILHIFYPENLYHLYFTYTSHQSPERPPQMQNSQKCLSDSKCPHFLAPKTLYHCILHNLVTKPRQDPTKIQNSMTD